LVVALVLFAAKYLAEWLAKVLAWLAELFDWLARGVLRFIFQEEPQRLGVLV
jgi:hypothetical protein